MLLNLQAYQGMWVREGQQSSAGNLSAPASLGLSPTRAPVFGTYQAIITRMVFSAPGARVKGTKSEAPSPAPGTGGLSITAPSWMFFQARVRPSHQPPLNQQWSTTVRSSSVNMAK